MAVHVIHTRGSFGSALFDRSICLLHVEFLPKVLTATLVNENF